ncbi:hypothetical protein Barb4_04097 [Bacteroidales bacterium Barb4]|nr:hypothetical protein Barb4_04097 [Bacteroidales bacterium Barb4]
MKMQFLMHIERTSPLLALADKTVAFLNRIFSITAESASLFD